MILLDTHVVVWAAQNSPRLGFNSREAIRQAEAKREAFVSAITPWEIAMLAAKGRLELRRPTGDWIRRILARPGIRLAPLEPAIAVDAGELPGNILGDPSDRIIIATARSLGCPLLTADQPLLSYAWEGGHLAAIDARY